MKKSDEKIAVRNTALLINGIPMKTGPRTYVVFGVMRGGTTMVAGLLRAFGIFMGGNIDASNQESDDFKAASPEQRIAAINDNNAKHPVWGWKHPNAIDELEALLPHLRNPHLICIYRDGVATAQGLNRWHEFEPLRGLYETLKRHQRNLDFITSSNVPTILISYEKAERYKKLFVSQFSNALGVDPNYDSFDFEGFLQAGSYKRLESFYR